MLKKIKGFFQETKSQSLPTSGVKNKEAGLFQDFSVEKATAIFLFLLPLFFLPLTTNFFFWAKLGLVTVYLGFILIYWLVKGYQKGKGYQTLISPITLPLLIFWAATALSFIFSIDKEGSLLAFGGLSLGVFLALFLPSVLSQTPSSQIKLIKSIIWAGAAVSVWTLVLTASKVFNYKIQIASLPGMGIGFDFTGFSPLGGQIEGAIFLGAGLALALGLKSRSLFKSISTVLLTLGLAATVYEMIQNPPVLLPLTASWTISIATVGESFQRALTGTGLGNHLASFAIYKPLSLNQTDFWNFRFNSGADWYLELLTTGGLALLASFGFLVTRLVRIGRRGRIGAIELGLGTLLLAGLAAPWGLTSQILFFVLLGLWQSKNKSKSWRFIKLLSSSDADGASGEGVGLDRLIVGGIIIVAFGYWGFVFGKRALADYYFGKAQIAMARGQIGLAYQIQQRAISFNPQRAGLRQAFSNINLSLANAIVAQKAPQKEGENIELTNEERQTIMQLVQQAIQEARLTAQLKPFDPGVWENLGNLYTSLFNFANGAEDWAVASYQEAIRREPTSPRLRLALGSTFFRLKNLNGAAQNMATAVALKGDYANARYNLAQVYKQAEQLETAVSELEIVSRLVCAAPDSQDCSLVNDELQNLRDQLKEKAQAGTGGEALPSTEQEGLSRPSEEGGLPEIPEITPPPSINTESGELSRPSPAPVSPSVSPSPKETVAPRF